MFTRTSGPGWRGRTPEPYQHICIAGRSHHPEVPAIQGAGFIAPAVRLATPAPGGDAPDGRPQRAGSKVRRRTPEPVVVESVSRNGAGAGMASGKSRFPAPRTIG